MRLTSANSCGPCSTGGFHGLEAIEGRDGVRQFHQSHPDIVILDVGLPDLDGWQVLERIRDMSDVPVLMLTALGTERDKVRGSIPAPTTT